MKKLSILERYESNRKELFEQKKIKQLIYSKKVLFHTKGKAFTLEDVNKYKDKTKKAFYQNEISSIAKIMNKNISIFHTATINPIFNLDDNDNTFEKVDDKLKIQYEHFKKFHRDRKQYKLKNEDGTYSRLDYKFIRIYELSDKINLHSHRIDILNSNKDIEHYLKGIIHARKNNQIGRVELAVKMPTFRYIKKLFKNGFYIRVRNKYIQLNLIKKHGVYTIENVNDEGKGNFIYFKILNDTKKDTQKNITKYVYSYLLKSKSQDEVSKDESICSMLKIRQQQFSKDFFETARYGIRKDILYRASNSLYSKIKRKNPDVHLTPSNEDMKAFIYYTTTLIKKRKVFKFDNYIFYTKSQRLTKNTRWIEILDTKKYAVETYENVFSDYYINIDKAFVNGVSSKEDSVKLLNDFIREAYYYHGLENCEDIEEYDKDFFKNKPYVSDLITDDWFEHQTELEQEEKNERMEYIENLIDTLYSDPSSPEIEIYEDF